MSPDLALASLDTAMSSGDESVILGALDSLSSVAIAAEKKDGKTWGPWRWTCPEQRGGPLER